MVCPGKLRSGQIQAAKKGMQLQPLMMVLEPLMVMLQPEMMVLQPEVVTVPAVVQLPRWLELQPVPG